MSNQLPMLVLDVLRLTSFGECMSPGRSGGCEVALFGLTYNGVVMLASI